MSRTLVVFYSRTGTARKVGLALANSRDWKIGEVRTRRPGARMLTCVVQAMLRLRPAIDYQGPDPAAFDVVVLVSPVWCGTLSGPMRSFLVQHGSEIRSHAVLMVMGGSGAPAACQAVDRLLRRAAIVTGELPEAVVNSEGHDPALVAFARRLLDSQDAETSPSLRRVA